VVGLSLFYVELRTSDCCWKEWGVFIDYIYGVQNIQVIFFLVSLLVCGATNFAKKKKKERKKI